MSHGRLNADVELAILLLVHTDVVTVAHVRNGWDAILQWGLEVFIFEHLPELLYAPLSYQELQACAVAQTAEAVVTEDRDYTVPYLWNALKRYERTNGLRKHRVGRQTTADKAVKARAIFWVVGTYERNILDLVGNILAGIA